MNKPQLINKLFELQNPNGCWSVIPETHKYYPDYLHYVPNFKAGLWVLILLSDLKCDPDESRIKEPLRIIQEHFYDSKEQIYSLKSDHFPIPCLNGNLIYLDSYFNGTVCDNSSRVIEFFNKNQRFDDGEYEGEKNQYCTNKSCYSRHTCYWGVVKLLKGLSFIPEGKRNSSVRELLGKCIDFVLLHKVCYSSHNADKIMIKGIDKLTFPNMYKSDFLEILWLLKREKVHSAAVKQAVDLLKSKKQLGGEWYLERKINNIVASVGAVNQPNPYITERAEEVLEFYSS